MFAILIGSTTFILGGWWFFSTYGDPQTMEIMFLIGSVVLSFWGGWRLGKITRE